MVRLVRAAYVTMTVVLVSLGLYCFILRYIELAAHTSRRANAAPWPGPAFGPEPLPAEQPSPPTESNPAPLTLEPLIPEQNSPESSPPPPSPEQNSPESSSPPLSSEQNSSQSSPPPLTPEQNSPDSSPPSLTPEQNSSQSSPPPLTPEQNSSQSSPPALTPEQRWKTRVAESGNCVLSLDVPTWDDYFDLVEQYKLCSKMTMFDGGKNMCMDGDMAPRHNSCTVMSFGISNEWEFDDAMAKWGCEVYSFDPTIGLDDHLRGDKIHFHNLGLSGKKGTIPSKGKDVPVESYRGVLEHVGLVNRTIDYLKIDVEGSEIDFFENVLYEDTDAMQSVKQIGVEIHVFDQNVQSRDRLWKIYHRLECLGFKKVYSELNTFPPTAYVYNNTRSVSCCYELVWVNQAFL